VKIVAIGDIPVFIDWSVLASACLLALFVRFDPTATFSLCLAYLLLICFHEAAHATAARSLGLKVLSIHISGFGGLCRFQSPATYGAAFLVASAGLLVQALLLVATIAGLTWFGYPTSSVGLHLAFGFTVVNAIVLVINVIPQKRPRERFGTDGYLLWALIMKKLHGRQYAWPDTSATFSPETRLTQLDGFAPPGFTIGIEILNDNSTPMEFVVTTLSTHLQVSRDEAIKLMLDIHAQGGVMISLPTYERAAAVAQAIASDALDSGHKLVCRPVGAEVHL
jgi:ATP-dependent Clp protease adapter protein ClpS